MRPLRILLVSACSLFSTMDNHAQQAAGFNYETSFVHPIRVSSDGSRLFVLNAPRGTVEVYSLADPDAPLLLKSIFVGLEPTSLSVLNNDEVWVVNSLSDCVSIVSVRRGEVRAVLPVRDEPSDIAFAGTPLKAFISVSAEDRIQVFDVASLLPLGSIAVFGKDPRALTVSPDGQTIYCAVHRSGNKTAILDRNQAPPPPPPLNPNLPAPPQTGLIVSADDPAYGPLLGFSLPDIDVVEIAAATLTTTRSFSGVGTILFDLAIHPLTGDLFVVNTDARNTVRFEPNLRGHAIDSRVTRISLAGAASVTPIDLNPLVDYTTLPNPAAKMTALAEPTALLPAGADLYVAAQGTDRIARLDPLTGQILARIDLGSTTTLNRRGPRGLSALPDGSRIYVFNRLSNSVSILNTSTGLVLTEWELEHDPTPAMIQLGRKFLYDAFLSGNGTMSCASCHVDGDIDLLAWDLGDRSGVEIPTPMQPSPFDIQMPPAFHPMKGPLLTQTLRGLGNVQPFHWRGDRTSLAEFNQNFDTLMGGSMIAPAEMAMLESYMLSIRTHPNPFLTMNRQFSALPIGNNARDGFTFFFDTIVPFGGMFGAACGSCHQPPIGMNGMVIAPPFIADTQPFRVAPVLNSYRRVGKSSTGPSKTGFGFGHDGAFATVGDFLQQPEFVGWPDTMKDDLETYMLSIDAGTAPTVGFPVVVNAASASQSLTDNLMTLLMDQSVANNCEVIGIGTLNGLPRRLFFNDSAAVFMSDDPNSGPWTYTTLRNAALGGHLHMLFMGVPPDAGLLFSIDRDQDLIMDGIDGVRTYGTPLNGTFGPLILSTNRPPRVGDEGFAFVVSNSMPLTSGLLAFSALPADVVFGGIPLYVDVTQPLFFVLPVPGDAAGLAALHAPIAPIPALAGFGLFVQAYFPDLAAPLGHSASNGLHFVIE